MKLKKAVDVSTKVGCVNMCEYCPQQAVIDAYKKRSDKFMLSMEDYKKFLSQISCDVLIEFAGVAECFLNLDCIKMMQYTDKKGYSLRLSTTLRNLKIEDISKLEEIPFVSVVVHLADERNLMKVDVDDYYIERLKAVNESKIQNLNFMVLGKISNKIKKEMGPGFKYANNISISSKAGKIIHLDLELPKFKKGRIICAVDPDLHSHTILPNGDVMLCCMDYGLKHIIGNINDKTYDELNESNVIKEVKQSWLKGDKGSNSLCRMCENSQNYYKYKINKFIKEPVLKLLEITKLINIAVRIKAIFKINLKK